MFAENSGLQGIDGVSRVLPDVSEVPEPLCSTVSEFKKPLASSLKMKTLRSFETTRNDAKSHSAKPELSGRCLFSGLTRMTVHVTRKSCL